MFDPTIYFQSHLNNYITKNKMVFFHFNFFTQTNNWPKYFQLQIFLRFSQPLRMISGHFCVQKINWNRAWHVKYSWNDLPVRSKFWYSISAWKYEKKLKTTFFPHSSEKKILIFFKQRWRCVKQHCTSWLVILVLITQQI